MIRIQELWWLSRIPDDSANRVQQVSGTLAGQQKTYASAFNYAPHGQPNWYAFGNKLCRAFTYNSRLQPNLSTESVQPGATTSASDCTYQADERLVLDWDWNTPVSGGGAHNNGNLAALTAYHGGPGYPVFLAFGESFAYDGVNRLLGASDSGGWSQQFGYDRYGNMWVSSGAQTSGLTPTADVYTPHDGSATTNRMSGTVYDASGNQLVIGADTMTYDAENRITTVTGTPVSGGGQVSYGYDGDGRRVTKAFADGTTTVYVYDAFGSLAAEYSSVMTVGAPRCVTCYLSTDHLGSTRMVTDQNGAVVGRHDYFPFGEELSASTVGRLAEWDASDSVKQKFTGKERDSETGLDYFGARYFSGAQGRFTSPDEPLADQEAHDPQSWNLYNYVRNNPLRYTDRDGRACIYDPQTNNFTGDCSSPGDEEVTQGNVPQQFTVGVGRDEANLLMLANIGDALTDPHTYAQFVSDAGRATASVVWPGPSAIAECVMPGGNCDKANLAMAAIPLPSWGKLTVDIEHIAERHMVGGALTSGRDVFLNLDKAGVKEAVRQAYSSAKTVSVQGERVLLEGGTKTGMTVQMWLNKSTNVIETAYPVGKQF